MLKNRKEGTDMGWLIGIGVVLAVIVGGGLAIAYARYQYLDATTEARTLKAYRRASKAAARRR